MVPAASISCTSIQTVTRERAEALRRGWGVKPDTKVILIVGRILRRKGHDVVVRAPRGSRTWD